MDGNKNRRRNGRKIQETGGATAANLALELYLHSDFQPDVEFLDGEVRARPAAEHDHSAWQGAISAWFSRSATAWSLRVRPSLRVQVTPENCLVPDVSILDAANPNEKIAARPPISVFQFDVLQIATFLQAAGD